MKNLTDQEIGIEFPKYFKTAHTNEFMRFTNHDIGIEVGPYHVKPTILSLVWHEENCQASNKREFAQALKNTEINLSKVITQARQTPEIEAYNRKLRRQAEYERAMFLGSEEVDVMQLQQEDEERINNYHEDHLFEN